MQAITENLGKCCNWKNAEAEVFHLDGEFCLICWQERTEPDIAIRDQQLTAFTLKEKVIR